MALVKKSIDGGTVTLTLNRSDQRNALNGALIRELTASVEDMENSPRARVIVITGAGESFCAGADLKRLEQMRGQSAEKNLEDSQQLANLFLTMARSELPLIARVNGDALGGGAGLVVACDWAFADEHVSIGFPEVRLGFVPAIVLPFLVRRIGEASARDLVLRGRRVTGIEAEEIGLVSRAVDARKLDDAVQSVAAEIAGETSRSAVGLTRRLVGRVSALPLEEAIDLAVLTNAFARGTDDLEAGLSAFLSGDQPPWRSSDDE